MSFINQPILRYTNEIRSAVLMIHGEKLIIATLLYDNVDVIPFDKMQDFFAKNLK